MEAIFSLPYSEHQAIERLLEFLPKSEGYGVYVPVSRQQARCDFVVLQKNRMLRVQVKSSRHFEWSRSPTLRFWYRNFAASYRPGCADVFFLFGLYPVFAQGRKVSDRHAHWRNLILVFSDEEMSRILRRTGKDQFFQFGIDPVVSHKPPKVLGTRGGVKGQDLTLHVLERRVPWLRRQFRLQP
jgi:hypothetical protein